MSDYLPQGFPDHIPHYHGDAVRQLFISVAALILIAAPFYADSLRTELPFEIGGALILVAIAALVNPHKQQVFLAAAIASGVGLVVYETWALYDYRDSTWAQFILREAIAVIFLVAFYFSMKTVRAFILGKVGKHDEAGEFDTPRSAVSSTSSAPPSRGAASRRTDDFLPWMFQKGNHRNNAAGAVGEGPRMSPGRSREEIEPKSHPYEERL